MEKICVLFGGQGTQAVGMGQDLYGGYALVRQIFECGSDIMGVDLCKICFEDGEALGHTRFAQPAIYAVSLAGYILLHDTLGITPTALAGHSLGEYGALTAAGVLSMENGFRAICARGEAMEEAAADSPGAMAAVMGAGEETVEKICEQTDGYVLAVNYNSTQQTVIAGDAAAVDAAVQTFAKMGLKTAKLAVAGAFHTELMRGAADAFYDVVKNIPFNQPKIPFYSNVTGARMDAFEDFPGYLRSHMVSPVRFTRQLAQIAEDGSEFYIEVGPGKVLCGLVKRTLAGTKPLNLENEKGLEKIRAALRE